MNLLSIQLLNCTRALRASIPRAYTTPLNKRKITIRMAFLFGAGCLTCEMFQTHGCLSPRLCRRTCKLTHLLPFKFPSHWLIWRWLHASPNSYFTPDVKIQRWRLANKLWWRSMLHVKHFEGVRLLWSKLKAHHRNLDLIFSISLCLISLKSRPNMTT